MYTCCLRLLVTCTYDTYNSFYKIEYNSVLLIVYDLHRTLVLVIALAVVLYRVQHTVLVINCSSIIHTST